MGLSDRDRDILAFEESWWVTPGSKGDAIRNRLGMSPTQYYRHLGGLVESSEALEHWPLLIRRLRLRRMQRRRDRFEGAAQPHDPRR
ncbi:MAG TPA: DUF3263 domain-containing protein [Candidatus Sulfotelmatobacter sp.]|nr:DUF3263 domain-containing protein [Candidatus Sulfotelmatobacter sp.]